MDLPSMQEPEKSRSHLTVLAKTNDNVFAERRDFQQPTTISNINVGELAIKRVSMVCVIALL